jgi:hypothetical protein
MRRGWKLIPSCYGVDARGVRNGESSVAWVLERRAQRGIRLSVLSLSPAADECDAMVTEEEFRLGNVLLR